MAVMQPDDDNKTPDARKEKEIALLYTDTLMSILDFDNRDLENNRHGQITQRQKKALQADLDDDRSGLALMMSITLGVELLLAFIMLSSGVPLTALAIGGALFIIPMMAFAYARQGGKQNDLDNVQVESVQGNVDFFARGVGGSGYGFLRVDGKTFPISPQQLHEFNQYDAPMMRVYYTPESEFLLSAEVLRQKDKKLKNNLTDEKPKRHDDNDDDMIITTGRNYNERKT